MMADAPLGLYTDRYEIAMAAAYWRDGRADEPAIFDYFFRTLPFGGGYAVFAGLATLVEALAAFRFSGEQLEFLGNNGFESDFLEYLEAFRFRGALWAPPEGEVVFPLEPVIRVEGGLLETQILETLLLNCVNFQTLVATKAARCRLAVGERGLSEFGLRRAQGLGGRWAARAACIGGFDTTSALDAAHAYGLKAVGTMAHSFIQSYDDELEAFRAFARTHCSTTVLLLDTYDTMRSGLPNAITVARELAERGETLRGVRLDSGDLGALAREVRRGLDEAGFMKVQIVASDQLDEQVMSELIADGAPIDLFGVGTAIATGAPDGALDGVYKLAQTGETPRLKASETLGKATLPGRKTVTRYRDAAGVLRADAIHLAGESTPERLWHPFEPEEGLDLRDWEGAPLLEPVVREGRPVGPLPSVAEAARRARESVEALSPGLRRFDSPETYAVGLSEALRSLRDRLLNAKRKGLPK